MFTGDQYDVSGGGMTSIVRVPADEFVLSFRSSGSQIYIFLLADSDVMTSDMIFIELTSNYQYGGICQATASYYQTVTLPYKRGRISRNCFYEQLYYTNNVSTYSHSKF
jgi:hypothetical protein